VIVIRSEIFVVRNMTVDNDDTNCGSYHRYLPIITSAPPFHQHQIIQHGDRVT